MPIELQLFLFTPTDFLDIVESKLRFINDNIIKRDLHEN